MPAIWKRKTLTIGRSISSSRMFLLHLLKLALVPALELAEPGAHCLLLVKPQFEAGREAISKAGLLKEPETAPLVAAELERWLTEDMGWTSLGLIPSQFRAVTATRSFCSPA